MAKNLPEFIRERRAEIGAELLNLKFELEQLDAAALAIDRKPASESPSTFTIKEMIVGVLRDAGRGLRANEILTMIDKKYGAKVPRESLSPQLTRLSRDDKMVMLNGRKWQLV